MKINKCRSCKSKKLDGAFSLGKQSLTGLFPNSEKQYVPCEGCIKDHPQFGHLQLKMGRNLFLYVTTPPMKCLFGIQKSGTNFNISLQFTNLKEDSTMKYFYDFIQRTEFECMKQMFTFVNNRMYCEYYKLYKVIHIYVTQNIVDKKIIETCKSKTEYPVYKDLEPYKEYDFDLIIDLHHDILQIISELQGHLILKDDGINVGLSFNIFFCILGHLYILSFVLSEPVLLISSKSPGCGFKSVH